MAQSPESPRPAQATPAEESTRDPTEIALSAIAQALEPSTEQIPDSAEQQFLLKRLAQAGMSPPAVESAREVARAVDTSRAAAAYAAARATMVDVSEDEALTQLKEALKSSINARLSSPDDHLNFIRNELKSVLQHVQSR